MKLKNNYPKRTSIEDRTGEPYMIRWSLLTLPFLTIKLHKFVRSDIDCMHDHPWAFVSVMLKGSYMEETPDGCRLVNAVSILYRPAKHRHRIYVTKPCWTLVFTGPEIRQWGFWTKEGWKHWRDYIFKGQRGGSC